MNPLAIQRQNQCPRRIVPLVILGCDKALILPARVLFYQNIMKQVPNPKSQRSQTPVTKAGAVRKLSVTPTNEQKPKVAEPESIKVFSFGEDDAFELLQMDHEGQLSLLRGGQTEPVSVLEAVSWLKEKCEARAKDPVMAQENCVWTDAGMAQLLARVESAIPMS